MSSNTPTPIHRARFFKDGDWHTFAEGERDYCLEKCKQLDGPVRVDTFAEAHAIETKLRRLQQDKSGVFRLDMRDCAIAERARVAALAAATK